MWPFKKRIVMRGDPILPARTPVEVVELRAQCERVFGEAMAIPANEYQYSKLASDREKCRALLDSYKPVEA
jgi:hypothetical protein